MYFYFDWTWIILVPAILLAAYAQMKVTTTFKKYSRVHNKRGITGEMVAKQLLSLNGINDVRVERTRGNLTDYYDPRSKVIKLSDGVYHNTSISALAVAAHETGHAVQHNKGYVPLKIRSAVAPFTAFASRISMPLIVIGLIFGSFDNYLLLNVGIILFIVTVIFQIITLPVEFNASNRALDMLESNNFLSSDEIKPAREVLSAAALTYVAAAMTAILNLVRLLILTSGTRDNDQ